VEGGRSGGRGMNTREEEKVRDGRKGEVRLGKGEKAREDGGSDRGK